MTDEEIHDLVNKWAGLGTHKVRNRLESAIREALSRTCDGGCEGAKAAGLVFKGGDPVYDNVLVVAGHSIEISHCPWCGGTLKAPSG